MEQINTPASDEMFFGTILFRGNPGAIKRSYVRDLNPAADVRRQNIADISVS